MDTEQDDAIYVIHWHQYVEMRFIFKNSRDEIVLTQEEARQVAGQLLQAAALAEKWEE